MDDSATIEPAAPDYIDLTADLVAAYVSHNNVPVAEIEKLITTAHAALIGLSQSTTPAAPAVDKPTPAQIRKSITHEALISFEDGKGYKTLKRHLNLRGLSPEAYRAKWSLPTDYPMTAAGYSEARSKLAHVIGLGQVRRTRAEAKLAAESAPASEKPKRAGRPRKAKEPAEA